MEKCNHPQSAAIDYNIQSAARSFFEGSISFLFPGELR